MECRTDDDPSGGIAAATLGTVSVFLLGASLVWAHHWSLLTITIVGGWALATFLTFLMSARTLRRREKGRAFAWFGMSCVLASVVLVAASGTVYAAGIAPLGGLCGGG